MDGAEMDHVQERCMRVSRGWTSKMTAICRFLSLRPCVLSALLRHQNLVDDHDDTVALSNVVG